MIINVITKIQKDSEHSVVHNERSLDIPNLSFYENTTLPTTATINVSNQSDSLMSDKLDILSIKINYDVDDKIIQLIHVDEKVCLFGNPNDGIITSVVFLDPYKHYNIEKNFSMLFMPCFDSIQEIRKHMDGRHAINLKASLALLEEIATKCLYFHSPSILFFGSGEFPCETFKTLIDRGYLITGLVTSKDKMMFKDSPKEMSLINQAKQHNIPFLIPNSLESEETYEWIREHSADLFCVISYKKLPSDVIALSRIGSFNIHASLLPFLKGAAPINHTIRLGCKTTGLTAFVLNDRIDCGNIIASKKHEISENETFGSLYKSLSHECANFCIKDVIEKVSSLNSVEFIMMFPEQPTIPMDTDSDIMRYLKAPKIHEDYMDGWATMPELSINRRLRSVLPIDGLHFTLEITNDSGAVVKRIMGKILEYEMTYDQGHALDILTDGKKYLTITNHDCSISVKKLHIAGKLCPYSIEEFLRGFVYFNREGYHVQLYDWYKKE